VNERGHRRVIEAGDSALLLQIGPPRTANEAGAFDADLNREAIGVAEAIRRARLRGVRDVVPAYRSVAVFFDPLETDVDGIRATLEACDPTESRVHAPRRVDVPVVYGGEWGPDLGEVAAFAGCDTETVIDRHVSRTYRVFMLGFLPGFPYMAPVDPSIAAPRRPTPRIGVPAGSVGIAGWQTGIYPSDSPGGWQIIGRTRLTLFDPDRDPPALFAPGDTVRFVRADVDVVSGFSRTEVRLNADTTTQPAVTVLKAGLLSTIQDRGRWGHQHLGVPPGGPMDPVAHDLANVLVGNSFDAATLEATLVGPHIRFEHPVRIAVTGGDLSPEVDGVPLPREVPTDCAGGSVLRFGRRQSGGRAYVAVAGGVDVPVVLGSRATHVQSRMGGIEGRVLRAGDTFTIGRGGPDPSRASGSPRASSRGDMARLTSGSISIRGGARLRMMRGPQADDFEDAAFEYLQRARFIISPQSNRMGYRLTGARVPVSPAGDMISDATFTGGLQIPPSGEPILLMADRQTTGGYPQIAVLISADLSVAAQLLPGDWIEFELCTRAGAIAALTAQRPSIDPD
jgi:KipI family sensor histidine kinase inhibitor